MHKHRGPRYRITSIRAGGVKFSQASSAALLDLVAVGDYRRSLTLIHNVESKNPYGRATGSWDSNAKLWPCKGFRKGKYASV